jgi:hypothetical protein
MKPPPISNRRVKAVFDAYPAAVRARLLALRGLIFAAARDAGAGDLVETLKWGQPAYLPATPRMGTTVRIDALKGSKAGYGAFFHCQTTLVATFRERYGDAFRFDGNRAIVFSADEKVPEKALQHCFALALAYHKQPTRTSPRCARPSPRR